MTYDAPSEREFTDNMRTAVDVCRLSRSTMSSWTSTTTNTALQNASFTLLSCSGPTKGESLDIPRPSDFAIPIVWPSGHEPEQSRWLDPVTSANVKIGAYRRPQRHASCKRNEIFSLLDEAGNWRAYSGRT